jgi:N-methylhydantoinase A/oxoprolinase/acetone carboxylase beta subunit
MLTGDSLTSERLCRERDALIAEAVAALSQAPSRVRVRHELRYRGQSFELSVEEPGSAGWAGPDHLRKAFAATHEQRYGYRDDSAEIELVNLRVSVWAPTPLLSLRAGDSDDRIEGPTIYPLPEATLYVPPGWSGQVDEWGTVCLERS